MLGIYKRNYSYIFYSHIFRPYPILLYDFLVDNE